MLEHTKIHQYARALLRRHFSQADPGWYQIYLNRDSTAKTIRAEKEKNRQYMENNLANLHQRSSGMMGNQDIVNYDQVRDVARPGSEQDLNNSFLRARKEIDFDDAAMDVDQPDRQRAPPPPPAIITEVPINDDNTKGVDRVAKLYTDRKQAQQTYEDGAHFQSLKNQPDSPTWPGGGGFNADQILAMDHAPDGVSAIEGGIIPHRLSSVPAPASAPRKS